MKKSISIVIALMLLINVFAVSAFAAVPSGNAIALTLTSDKDSYAAGDTVNVTLSIETTSAVAGLSAGEIEFGYNDAIFEPAADISGSPALLSYGCTYGDIIASNLDAAGSFVKAGAGEFYADDVTAYGWNAGLHIGVAENFEGINYVDCSAGAKTFVTFPLKIKAGVADGTYTIGVNKYAFEDGGTGYLVDGALGGIYGAQGGDFGVGETDTFACGTVTITVGAGGGGSTEPEQPTITVENLDTKVRWATADEEPVSKDVIYVGFEGKISGLTDVSTLAEIGFKFSTSDSALATATNVKSFVIYDFTADAANTYKFRSIVRRPLAKADIDGTTTHNIYAQAYVMVTGATTPIAATNIISTTLQAEYAQGVTNGMEDRFA